MTKEQFDLCKIVDTRRCGNSTRIVDLLVQELFTTGQCNYWDHADRVGNMALDRTLRVLQRRLYNEHGLRPPEYKINREERIITLTISIKQ